MASNQIIEKIKTVILYLTGLILFIPLIPPVVNDLFYFPYIFPKALVFKVITEALVVLYFYLVYLSRRYRPKINWIFLFLVFFLFSAFISSFFGLDFGKSFWGNIERSEGLVFWFHLLAFFVVIINVFKEKSDWHFLFNLSLISGFVISLIALCQIFGLKIVASPGGLRATAWFGNASFLASYMIFQVALAAYLFINNANWYFKTYYAALFLLFIYVIFNTSTRGAIFGLVFGLLFCGGLILLRKDLSLKIRLTSGALIIVLILSGALLYLNRSSSWVIGNEVLKKITFINAEDITTRNRLASWQAAWTGWQGRSLFGYGLENFNIIFNKNFPAFIYDDEGSQIWFDRAHNVIFDRGVTTGFLGLSLYLVFIFLPLYFLYKSDEPFFLKLPLVGLVLAFFIQDLFVFESTTTYIMLMFIWAFMSLQAKQFSPSWLESQGNYRWPLIVSVVAFFPIVFFVNIVPASANMDYLQAIRMSSGNYSSDQVIAQYQKVLNVQTYGLPEYRFRFIQFIDQAFSDFKGNIAEIQPYIEFADQNLEKMITDEPQNAAFYLLAMRHYNVTNSLMTGESINRLNHALSFLPKLVELAPARSQIYREASYSNLYLYQLYKNQNNSAEASRTIDESLKLIKQAIEINPKVIELRVDQIMILLNKKDTAEILNQLKLMESQKIVYESEAVLQKLINLSINNKNYELVVVFSEKLAVIQPKNIEVKINLALAYAYLGKESEAIQVAQEVKILGQGTRDAQVNEFIAAIKAGKFKSK
ncbi:MAG: O-antigen ligase family protein [Candidatus Buchananbacteria bacterium]